MIFMDLLIVAPVLSGRNLAGFFTASSLLAEKDGGGGRIIRHFVPHPSGRAKARYPSLSDSL
ncbi:hypothetical protein ACTVJ2_14000 [Serratia nevei]|uniref:hypothetical protein n=1 Tax=Serratia nevei TaxID=2703794 RepID=UPI003FA701C6